MSLALRTTRLHCFGIGKQCKFLSLSAIKCKKDSGQKSLRRKLENVNVYKQMSIMDLAAALNKPVDHVFECLSYIPTNSSGSKRHNKTSVLDFDVIREVCLKSGVRATLISHSASDKKVEIDVDVYRQPEPDPSVCKPRPPVVTIMGHVDHGKTTLLDYLRSSNIVNQEFGGITQHIGAFSVKLKNGKSITFLDTPGHAAFSAMRGRGAKMTDIIVLVVAADDGVMPQTLESIKHAKNSRVPIVVAVNKCDKPEAEMEACIEDLALHGVTLEEAGGDIIGVKISALNGTNVDALQDAIITQAELLDIKADYSSSAEGRVIETKNEPGRGKLASVLVQRGVLKVGSFLVAGTACAKVRALFDENRKNMKVAEPGTAVEITGWRELPSPGAEVLQVESESQMKTVIKKLQEQKLKEEEDWSEIKKKVAAHRSVHSQAVKMRQDQSLTRYTRSLRREINDMMESQQSEEEIKPQLSLIIKADVDGSLEAITSCLSSYADELCELRLINVGVGDVTESDVELMSTCDGGVILAFNTRVPDKVGKLADEFDVTINNHNIIYRLVDDVKDMLNERIPSAIQHTTIGEAVVQKPFFITEKIDGKKTKIPVAGCLCTKGVLDREQKYKLVRNTDIIHKGTLFSMKHFKSEVMDIKEGMECGLAFSDHTVDIEEGDVILCYEESVYQPTVDWNLPF